MKINNFFFYRALVLFFITSICSCKDNVEESAHELIETSEFAIGDFLPIANSQFINQSQVELPLDYKNSISEGFIIPSVSQTTSGYFTFRFSIKNKTNRSCKYLYKIYYQNDSYKFPELDKDGKSPHPLSWENFYGSWEDSVTEFRTTELISPDGEFHFLTDSFRIVGNPRNEIRYFQDGRNDRWKRNPRVGEYSFLLVVMPETASGKALIPASVRNISKPDKDGFVNPFYWFLHGPESSSNIFASVLSERKLRVYAKPDLGMGIYVNPDNFSKDRYSGFFHNDCNQDSVAFHFAAFEQFINNVDPSMRFENIPVVRDIMSEHYTKVDYNWDKAFYLLDDMISILPGIARTPCETVLSDKENHKITIRNPATKEGEWRKESVGIRTRHGFVYGKYRLKCKLTELLNSDNVWNGLTNAIWLLSQQGSGQWNSRRTCEKGGFMATYWGGENDKRVPVVDYSEIDFEILKTPPYCPSFNFPPLIKNPVNDQYNTSRWNLPFSDDLKEADGMITVACTNWDMACLQPENFKSGCNEIYYKGNKFYSHRWNDNYRALTQKKYSSDNELFGSEYYYFEIDWRPDEIIWRIGPSPDKMQIVGYMNDKVTTIPNNQMTLIVTQEYHNTKWWPGSPFIQENIPFPSKDLVGEIYELVIY